MSLSQIELVWVRVRVEWECFWVNLREDNKVSESKIAVCESNMTEFKDGCLHQVQWEWMSQVFLCKMAESKVEKFQDDRIQDGCHHQVESEWMSKVFFMQMVGTNLAKCEWVWEKKLRWPNPRWPISRVWNTNGYHHQVNWECMSLSQIELVWVRVRVEWECFWVNLREDNKVSESKMAVSEPNMAEFKMAVIIKLSLNEWVKFFCVKWLNPRWQISRWLASSSWVRKNEWSFFHANGGNQSWQVWVSLRGWTKMAKYKMAKFKMAKLKMASIINLSENEWVSVRLE